MKVLLASLDMYTTPFQKLHGVRTPSSSEKAALLAALQKTLCSGSQCLGQATSALLGLVLRV